MSLATDIDELRVKLNAETCRPWQAFLALYRFIDRTQNASFGWLKFGPNALEGVDVQREIGIWLEQVRDAAANDAPFSQVLRIADLGTMLSAAQDAETVQASHSLALITTLLVLERAYANLHPGDVVASRDTPHFQVLRARLRAGQPLFEDMPLRVYPQPRRDLRRATQGQPSVNSLLRRLVVIEPPPALEVEYQFAAGMGRRARNEFKRIGVVPTIVNCGELRWTAHDNQTYSVVVHDDAVAAIHARIDAAMSALCAKGVDIIVLPELVGAPWIEEQLTGWMARDPAPDSVVPTFILAGTRLEEDDLDQIRNRARVLGKDGVIAWMQDKLHAYTFEIGHQRDAGFPMGEDDLHDRMEAIAIEPRKLVIVDLSPSQRVVICTCEDFAQNEPHAATIRAAKATLLLVPVMAAGRESETASWVHRRAMDYIQQPGSASVVANSGALVRKHREKSSSYAQVLAAPQVRGVWEPIRLLGEDDPVAWIIDLDRLV